MDELSEEDLADAEGVNVQHSHDGIASLDGTLVEHLQAMHGMAVDSGLSPTTQDGVHDRLHQESKAADDPA